VLQYDSTNQINEPIHNLKTKFSYLLTLAFPQCHLKLMCCNNSVLLNLGDGIPFTISVMLHCHVWATKALSINTGCNKSRIKWTEINIFNLRLCFARCSLLWHKQRTLYGIPRVKFLRCYNMLLYRVRQKSYTILIHFPQ
jgi:hypothetical protein